MIKSKKPQLGVLALMLDAYEGIFNGITKRQEDYVEALLKGLSNEADFVFKSAAKSREQIELITKEYNNLNLDGIVILLLCYSEGQHLVRAMQQNHLPLALVLVQPDETVQQDFEELDLTVNQAIHGSQDNANCLMRANINCCYFAGSKAALPQFISDFGHAAQTVERLKKMRIGVIGKLAGMGDVITDDMAFYRVIGPELTYDSIGTVQSFFQTVTKEEIDEVIKRDEEIFDIDENLSRESHSYAIKLYIGIKKYLEQQKYDGYTLHFDELSADGRFEQLPLLAASHLMADGYGYAAEGDSMTAALVSACNTISQNANFSEMYMMDFKNDAILFCHAGEGNWASARKDCKPKLIDRYFGEGGLSNPPTPIFTPQYGGATVITLTHVSGDKFRMVCAKGEILDKNDLTKCDMPYFFFRPDCGVSQCVTRWLEVGGGHHEVVMLGDQTKRIKLLCKLLNIELVCI